MSPLPSFLGDTQKIFRELQEFLQWLYIKAECLSVGRQILHLLLSKLDILNVPY